jgi:membrane protein
MRERLGGAIVACTEGKFHGTVVNTTHANAPDWREHGRDIELGREAGTPREIPRRGWFEILKRTRKEISRDNVPLVAAGVAFYSLLALPPAFAAAISLWGLIADPAEIQSQIAELARLLPPEAAAVMSDQLRNVAARSDGALGWTAAIGFLLSLWSARAAVNAMIGALNIVYEEEEDRGFFKLTFLTLALTLFALIGGVLALLLVAGVPAILNLIGLGGGAEIFVHVLRWAVLIGLAVFGLAALYRFGPARHRAQWGWVTWGAGTGAVLWIIASAAFSLFVANFGKYGETYGAIAGVVLLLMWLWISALAALVGAEINSEMEHQTRRDTTTGADKPVGARDAWVADHVAEDSAAVRR